MQTDADVVNDPQRIVGIPEYKRWTRDSAPRPWSPSRTPPSQDEDVWTPSHSESVYLSKKSWTLILTKTKQLIYLSTCIQFKKKINENVYICGVMIYEAQGNKVITAWTRKD